MRTAAAIATLLVSVMNVGHPTGGGAPVNAIRPEDFHQSYADAFNSGDVASVVGLYERAARFVPQPDQVASGHAAIGSALRRFQAMGTMAAETRYCITSGDVALASASWRINGAGPDGEPVALQGTSADLLRRQTDGRWLLVVDHPFGGT
jgi:ketosteroid isomerase-like protein